MHRIRTLIVTSLLVVAAASSARGLVAFEEPQRLEGTLRFPDQTGLQLATDRAGNWVLVWLNLYFVSSPGATIGDIVVSTSSDEGATWTSPTPVVQGVVDWSPRIAADQFGNWVISWVSNNRIFVSRSTDVGASWSPAVLIPTAPPSSPGLSSSLIGVDDAGNWNLIWAERMAAAPASPLLRQARSVDGGATWSSAMTIDDGRLSTGAALAVSPSGTWMIARLLSDGIAGGIPDSIQFIRSNDGGLNWEPCSTLSSVGIDQWNGPSLAPGAGGAWVLSLRAQHSRLANEDLFSSLPRGIAARSDDDGATWTSPIPLYSLATAATPNPNQQDSTATVASDGESEFVVTNDLFEIIEQSLVATSRWSVIQVQSDDLGLSWSPASMLQVLPHGEGMFQQNPTVAFGGGARWLTAFLASEPGSGQWCGLACPTRVMVARGSTCGSGLPGPGKQCDDGNRLDGDGCSSTCQMEVLPASIMRIQVGASRQAGTKIRTRAYGLTLKLGRGNRSVDDPVLHGGKLRLTSPVAGVDVAYELPAARWHYVGRPEQNLGYRYNDPSGRAGPVRKITLTPSRGMSVNVTLDDLKFPLATNPDPVSAILTTGSRVYQSRLGGKTWFRPGRSFQAVKRED